MTTIAFQPNNSASPPFQAQVTLDGVSYSMITMANFYAANRWYVQLYDQSGNLVQNMPLIGSPQGPQAPVKHKTAALTKMSSHYETSAQASEADNNSRET